MTDRERFYLRAATQMAETAATAMKAVNEFLRLAEEARLESALAVGGFEQTPGSPSWGPGSPSLRSVQ